MNALRRLLGRDQPKPIRYLFQMAAYCPRCEALWTRTYDPDSDDPLMCPYCGVDVYAYWRKKYAFAEVPS